MLTPEHYSTKVESDRSGLVKLSTCQVILLRYMVANFNHDSCWDPIQLFDDRKWRGLWSPISVLLVSEWNFHHFWGFGDWPHFETPIFIEGVTGISWFWDAQIELLRYWHSSPYSSEVLPQWWGRSNQCLVWCLVLALDREWLLKFTIFIKLAWTKHLRISWDDLSLSSQILGCKCWFSFVCCICVVLVSPLPPCHCLRWFCWSNVSSWKPWNRVPGTLHCLLVWDFQFLSCKLKGFHYKSLEIMTTEEVTSGTSNKNSPLPLLPGRCESEV